MKRGWLTLFVGDSLVRFCIRQSQWLVVVTRLELTVVINLPNGNGEVLVALV